MNREGEKGAALVMALLISALLLVVSAGLLLEATMNTYNVTDSTSEQQAFNAAESGIQAAVYVLRDNVTLPDTDLIVPSPDQVDCPDHWNTAPELCKVNRIDYLKALDIAKSNASTTGFDTVPRMSRWMSYAGTERVSMGTSGEYSYKLDISDPDHTGTIVAYSTVGKFFNNDSLPDPPIGPISRITYGSGADKIVVEYVAQPSIELDTLGGEAAANFGSFRVTVTGNGALIPSYNRFELHARMSKPYFGSRVIRGYIVPNTAATQAQAPRIIFDSRTMTLQGSVINLNSVGGTTVGTSYVAGPPPGFDVPLNPTSASGPVENVIAGTISSPEPIRLLIRSTGYGPRGSTKVLEAIIQKDFFNGITAPATLTLVGPPSGGGLTFTFNPGSSNVAEYSGQDQESTDIIPPIGTTHLDNLDVVHDSVDGLPPHPFNGNVTGVPSDISLETEDPSHWLYSPATLDATVKRLQQEASEKGSYYPSGEQPTTFGDNATGLGLTFCDGDCEFTGAGGGIMVVTGKLTLKGNFSFRGMIIVTGSGGVERQGAGNGEIFGNMIVAPYENSSVLPATELATGASFLPPQYDLSGGGNSTIAYNSTALSDGLLGVSNFVLGVAEK